MQVDKRSLIDLGILPDASGAWPLIGLLDHTHSRAGLDALKGQLANPLGDATEIRRRQQLLWALPTAPAHVQWTPLVSVATS
jgi:DNA mismatch repair ATPase MutS